MSDDTVAVPPAPQLPTTPGSVIEAEVHGEDVGPQRLILDTTWCNRFTEANEDELTLIRVLFDAAAQQEADQ